MADNYLEKRMADYKSGALTNRRVRKHISRPLEGETFRFDARYERGRVEELRRKGAQVIITAPMNSELQILASVYGVKVEHP